MPTTTRPPWSVKWCRPQSCGKSASPEPKAPQTGPWVQDRTSIARQCVQVTCWEQDAEGRWGPPHPAPIFMGTEVESCAFWVLSGWTSCSEMSSHRFNGASRLSWFSWEERIFSHLHWCLCLAVWTELNPGKVIRIHSWMIYMWLGRGDDCKAISNL